MAEVPLDDAAKGTWRLRVEGVAREIDATFTSETLPAEVAALRARIVQILAPAAEPGPS